QQALGTAKQLVLEGVAKEAQKSRLPPRRYSVLRFYHVRGTQQQALATTETLAPPAPGTTLELHFWLDLVPGGIDYQDSDRVHPSIEPPPGVPYPVSLTVDVWSETVRLPKPTQPLELRYSDPTEHARFALDLPSQGENAILFVFVRRDSELIAVFRVAVVLTPQPQTRAGAQVLEDVYLAGCWFRFEQV